MSFERSAGAVVFRKEENRILYLLLHYPRGSRTSKPFWDLPKGHVEKDESVEAAAKREVAEETGIKDINFVPDFKRSIRYFFRKEGGTVFKVVTFLLAETKTKEVKISPEHIGFEWLPRAKALERLTYKKAREILEQAHDSLLKSRDEPI